MKHFCPNCGTEIKPGLKFCPNCGYDLSKKASGETTQSKQKPVRKQPARPTQARLNGQRPAQTRTRQTAPRKPWSRKKKITVSTIAAVVIVLIGLFAYGHHYYDQFNQVNRIVTAIRKDDNAQLAKVVTTNNPDVKINASSVRSITNYYKVHADSLNLLKNTLIANDYVRGISLVQDGHYFLFFPKYKLDVDSYQPTVETNHPGSRIYVDGKYVTTAKENGSDSYTAKLAPMLGGSHLIKVQAAASGHKLSSTANVNLWSNRDYDCNIKTANLAVLGPKGAEVCVGDKNYGKIKGQAMDLPDFQYNDETAIYLIYRVNGKKFVSEESNVSDVLAANDGDNFGNNSDDDSDLQEARNKTNEYNNKLTNVIPTFKGAPSLDTVNELVQDCFQSADADAFIGGKANKYYKSFHQMAHGFNNSDKIQDWDAEPDIYNVYPIGGGVYAVNAKIDYEFEHSNNTHIQVAHYPQITFKNDGSHFKILSVGGGKIIYDKTKKD